MKKVLLTLAATAMLALGAKADEGMWLLPLLQKMNEDAMTELGCRLTPEQIYSINNSSLKDAIVQFGGGCTGEMISEEGLLVTNHHCGYSSIQKLSTPEHNYLEDGYWAMRRSEEIPVSGLTVTFLERMTDVTDILDKVREKTLKEYKKDENAEANAEAAVAASAQALVDQAEAENPGCDAQIMDFYDNNVQYLMVYKTFRDVRFVGAPPVSMGKFGGETDNWVWPRHTCDFSMFRVYAGADNQPADYSEDNVPYRPKKALTISLKGYKDGDFTMIMGYPGGTQRFQTADQLAFMMERHGISVKARTVRQDAMMSHMEADPAIRLKYANKYASSANAWKKWQGEQLAFDKLGIIARQQQAEKDFMEWVGKKRSRAEKYDGALDKISAGVETMRAPYDGLTLLSETLYKIGTCDVASAIIRSYRDYTLDGQDTVLALSSAIDDGIALFKDFDIPTERDMAVAVAGFYRDNVAEGDVIDALPDLKTMDLGAWADKLFAESVLADSSKLSALKGESFDEARKKLDADPGIVLYNSIINKVQEFYQPLYLGEALVQGGAKAYTAGQLEWKEGQPSYPDANFTMRLTYGTVKSYSPKDGVIYKINTTLKGVMEKEDPDNYEFIVPSKLKALYEAKDYGQYADRDGSLPACFLTNNDITGGNSGSPVMNADGQLIGLAFDGNWESMSSDVFFEPELQRCICVDIRYVLFAMDKFGGAGWLLDEMNIVK